MEQSFLIVSEYGIHARPATRLVNLAMSFEADINLTALGKTVNLKSIMGVMSLGIYRGELISIHISGSDQEKAMLAVIDFMTTEGIGKRV